MRRKFLSDQPSLRQRIAMVMVIFIVFNLIEVATIQFFVYGQYRDLQELNRSVVELNQERFSEKFTTIHKEAAYLISNEVDFIKLPLLASAGLDYQNSIEQIQIANNIRNRLLNLSNVYGNQYYFWCYDSVSGTFLDSYGTNEQKRTFRSYIIDKLEEEPESLVENKGFGIEDGRYISMINHRKTIYLGAMITINDFYQLISQNSSSKEYRYAVYDESGALVESRVYSGADRVEQETVLDKNNFLQEEMLQLDNCSFSVGIAVTSRSLENANRLRSFLILTQVLFATIAILMIIYAQQGILLPLKKFSKMLEDFKKDETRIQPEKVQELGEAGVLLNQLVEQISELEKTVYEEKIKSQKVQLDFQQIRIRPHFFINCLNVIHSMARVGRTDEIEDLCLCVSSYLRSLYSCSNSTYPLQEELALIQNYLEIVKEVNGQKFTLHTEIEAGTETIQIPPLLIETFVENSLKYAKTIRSVEIDITVHKRTDGDGKEILLIQVEDTGKGFEENTLKALNDGVFQRKDERHQIGIINVVERLDLMYGVEAEISFQNTGKGAGVFIRIPVKEA